MTLEQSAVGARETFGIPDVHADELGVRARRHAGAAPDEAVPARRTRQRHDDPFTRFPRVRDGMAFAVLLERIVDPVGDPQEGELAEGAEIADPEVAAQRSVDPLGRVDVAVRHTTAERLRAHVDELDLLGAAHDRVGHRLALRDAGDPLDDVVE